MVWPSSFPECFYILAFLARHLSTRLYHQRVSLVTVDPTCSFAQAYRLRCLYQRRSARMTFRCSLFASPRLFRCYSNSVKCATRFSAALIYLTDCLFQTTKALFVTGTYDLLQNLGEVFEQFHRLAAQYWSLLSRHRLALWANAREQNAHHDETLKNLVC